MHYVSKKEKTSKIILKEIIKGWYKKEGGKTINRHMASIVTADLIAYVTILL